MRALPALVLLLLLAACGRDGLDRGDPDAVFVHAMAAVHDGDWAALSGLLTKDARMEMERDLARLKRRLASEADGQRERSLAQERLGEQAPAAIRAVVDGGPGEGLRFFARLMPRERRPPTRGMQVEQARRSVLYALADGTLRQVRLVQQGGEWWIDDLQL